MTVIKRCVALLAAFAICMTAFSGCGEQKETDIYEMRPGLTARDVRDEMGIGLNLGNTFEAYSNDDSNLNGFAQVLGEGRPSDYETCWGAPVTTREMIDGIRDCGFKTVRIPVFWGNGMADGSDFTVNEDVMARVEEVVKWALEDGLYVVMNMHHYDERLIMFLEKEDALHATERVWTQVAEHFKDYGDHLVFEGFNEYLGGVMTGTEQSDEYKFDYCNEMNQTFVDAVRATGGNNSERILIASGFNTNIDRTTSWRFRMPEDTAQNKLMVSVHYIDNNMYWSNQIGTENWYNYSKSQCQLLYERFSLSGIPVFVGECTTPSSYAAEGRMPSDAKYGSPAECVNTLMDMAVKDYGFIYVFWDTHSDQSFYSRTDLRLTDSKVAKEIKKLSK